MIPVESSLNLNLDLNLEWTTPSFVDTRTKEERAIDQGEQEIGAAPAHRSQPKNEIRRKISGRPEYP